MWVFGYGSLIWKANFPYERKLTGYVEGYDRRFYQQSHDHRGTKDKPGRVVTLVSSNETNAQVWGVAYLILQRDIQKVIGYLDFREKEGYERMKTIFYPRDSNEKPVECTTYVGTFNNLNYSLELDDDVIAKQIFEAQGTSGTNREYIIRLAIEMRIIAPEVNDEHLFSIEAKVIELRKKHNEKSKKKPYSSVKFRPKLASS